MTLQTKLRAVGTLAAGLGTAIGLVLLARGEQRHIYPFAIAASLTGAVLGAIAVLGDEPPRAGGTAP